MAILRDNGCNRHEKIVGNFHSFCESDMIKGQIIEKPYSKGRTV
ncbi:MAG: hypothetical protein PWR16_879 [Methanoculleus sp.]|nr:hypothetical protein [Methanoculleus sp.]